MKHNASTIGCIKLICSIHNLKLAKLSVPQEWVYSFPLRMPLMSWLYHSAYSSWFPSLAPQWWGSTWSSMKLRVLNISGCIKLTSNPCNLKVLQWSAHKLHHYMPLVAWIIWAATQLWMHIIHLHMRHKFVIMAGCIKLMTPSVTQVSQLTSRIIVCLWWGISESASILFFVPGAQVSHNDRLHHAFAASTANEKDWNLCLSNVTPLWFQKTEKPYRWHVHFATAIYKKLYRIKL